MAQLRQREAIAREAMDGIATGVALLPQTGECSSGRCYCCATSLRRGWWSCAPTALQPTPRQGLPVLVRQPRRARRSCSWLVQPDL